MGLPINNNTDYQDWYEEIFFNNTKINPLCWDGVSSSKYFGPAVTKLEEKESSKKS